MNHRKVCLVMKENSIAFVVEIEKGSNPHEVMELMYQCMEDTNFCPYGGLWKITFEPCEPAEGVTDGISLN